MKAIPTDPITGKEGTWKLKKAGNLLEVTAGPTVSPLMAIDTVLGRRLVRGQTAGITGFPGAY